MTRLRVALLNAAYNGEEAWANFDRDVPVTMTNYNCVDGTLPSHDDVDAAIVTGSSASVYWDEAWIAALRDWLTQADTLGIPLLGVCFGHQIIATALGGEVTDMGEYELGYHEIRRTGDSPLFDGFDASFVAFCSHHDEVVCLPSGATADAETSMALQSFRRGHSFGIQFHPEFDRETAVSVIGNKEISAVALDRANATVTDGNVALAQGTKRIFENFLTYASRVRTPETASATRDETVTQSSDQHAVGDD